MTDEDVYLLDEQPPDRPAGVWRCATCSAVIRQQDNMTPSDLREAARIHVAEACVTRRRTEKTS